MTKKTGTPEIAYKDYDADQIDAIKDLWEGLRADHEAKSTHFKKYFRAMTFNERKKLFLKDFSTRFRIRMAFDGVSAVGYCVSTIDATGAGEVDSIFVADGYRGGKIGHAMMEDALAWLRDNDVKKAKIVVACGNEKALDFYRSFGFYPRTYVLENGGDE